jgi:hypothetical protein
MHGKHGLALLLSVTPLMLLSTPALSDGVAVNITNDGTEDIVVTVYDMSLGPKAVILSQRVNGFTTIPVNVSQDAHGRANLAWTAVTVDPHNRKCGHADRMDLGKSASVNVHADADCGVSQPSATGASFEK